MRYLVRTKAGHIDQVECDRVVADGNGNVVRLMCIKATDTCNNSIVATFFDVDYWKLIPDLKD